MRKKGSTVIQNGELIPLSELPTFNAWEDFCERLFSELKRQARIVAFFATPAGEVGEGFDVFAVLARDRNSNLAVYRVRVKECFPSLASSIPQLHLFEREIAEQYGLDPVDHPWLKPVRFHGVWPGQEDVWGRNPNRHPRIGEMEFYQVEGEEVHEVAVGPVHAGVIEPGHFRFQCHGEKVMHLEISLGYQHRGVEQLLIGGPHPLSGMQLEAVAGDSTVAHMTAHSMIIEALSGCIVPPRAQAVRAIGLELERLANHVGDIGALAGDIGFLPTASFCGRLRGDYLNMTAELCGSRFGRGLVRPGGVLFDIEPELTERLLKALEPVARHTAGALQLFFDTPSVISRLEGTGRLSRSIAEDLGLVGVAAKACGVPRDSRFFHPTGMYKELFEELITDETCDVLARARVRNREITVSIDLLRRMLASLPRGPVRQECPELQEEALAVALVEGWRGEVVHVAITGADKKFSRYKIIDPSFHNWSGLAMAMRDEQISDFPLCNKSFNLSYCGVDL